MSPTRTKRTRVLPRGSSQNGSSQDVCTQSSVQLRTTNRQSRNIDHNLSLDVQGHSNLNQHPKSNVQNCPQSLQRMSNANSESEDEDLTHDSHIRLNHCSDVETEESLHRSRMSKGNGVTKELQQKPEPSTSQQIFESDSSSDCSVISPKIIKNRKRPLSPTSESDSSDSSVPLAFRSLKHIRVISSDKRSSPEISSDSDNHNARPMKNDPETSNTVKFSQHTIEEYHESGTSSSDPSNQMLGGKRLPIDESDSDSDVITQNHSTWRKRIPVIETENDTDSPNEDISRRSLRVSNIQEVAHEVNAVLGIYDSRRRTRNTGRSERFLNIDESSRIRQLGGNTWTVSTQIESTEDDFTPLSNHRRVRGRSIPVVDSESNSESDSSNNNEVVITPERGNEIVITFGPEVLNLREMRVPDNNEHNIISHYNLRRRNATLIQNEDESSSSDSDIRPRLLSNRIAPILQSDDSSSNSSTDSEDSIPIRSSRRYSRSVPIIDDNEDLADSFPDVSIKVSNVIDGSKENKGNSSDSDGEAEKCPICLAGLKLQEIGRPKSCDHKFCSHCIKEWATRNNTCPVDRKIFDTIVVYDKSEGKIIHELPVEKTNPFYDFEFNEIQLADYLFSDSSESSWFIDNSDGDGPEEICYVCGSSNQPHRMITCDTCNNVYHLYCVNPPLRTFPTINWYCSYCDGDLLSSSDSD